MAAPPPSANMLQGKHQKLSHVEFHEPTLNEMITAKEGVFLPLLCTKMLVLASENYIPYHWDGHVHEWVPIATSSETCGISVSSLSLVTFNVWFERIHRISRALGLMDVVRKCSPDVMALQESSVEFLKAILSLDWIRNEYWCSDCGDCSTFGQSWYGVVLLSKIPCSNLVIKPLPTRLGRKLVVATLRYLILLQRQTISLSN